MLTRQHTAENTLLARTQDEFLTGKLAALGIDEDLELSGGEEENEDPAAVASPAACPGQPSATGGGVFPPTPASPPANEAGGGEAPRSVSSAGKPNPKPPPVAAGGEGGGRGEGGEAIEDGELLEMLEKPLQTARHPPQQRGSRHSSNRERKGGDGRGRRRPKSNGRAFGRNVTIKECALWMCERLGEPKYYLMCRVVATIGYKKTKKLLEKVQETQVRIPREAVVQEGPRERAYVRPTRIQLWAYVYCRLTHRNR